MITVPTTTNRLAALICFVSSLFALGPAAVGEAQGWAVSLGAFDVADTKALEAGVEYRLAPFAEIHRGAFLPAVGVSGTSDGGVWIYGSLRFDWEITERWIVTPHVGASLFEDGGGKDLGGPLEFRSGIEITHRLARGARLGLVFYHLSHARIYQDNPGSNSIVLTYGFGR